ncbi:hydrogen peroxide-inducible genes activator [Rhizobium paknamense]|uniref:LysR family hydrogen peroxide-inducible transcriptional activator n=1 Tax=Rhizobium paknamense TaxID=1206817 RepID=A0ABU0IKK3_9HYPH|nr:hydrogen peroxide-inducible genes activator [Rhizobium paknamense]MDQ0458153.1 LysR family hydrogen peroxide-inducible transcriptional activator [Rhizobium paknamense]
MPFRPSHRQLEYLVALGETGHFGEAARRCNVSQPTLSVQVALLEKQLGAQLIERAPGQITPTPVGAEIIAAARIILAGLDDIKVLAASARSHLGGVMRLGVVSSFGPYFLPYLLPTLHARHRELKLYIREDRPRVLEQAVQAGEVDCGLGQQPDDPDTFCFQPICREVIYLGVHRDHPLARQTVVPVEALRGERLLTLGRGHRLLDDVRALASLSGATLTDDYEGTSLDALRQMVSIEMGLSLFPELYVRSEMAREENVRLLRLQGWPGERVIGFYWRRISARKAHFEALASLGEAVARDLLKRKDGELPPPS